MAELTAADVETFTGGRLRDDGGTGEVSRMLRTALGIARAEVGWHVSPIKTADTCLLDGPASALLVLPTLRCVNLTSVTEHGTPLNLDKLLWSVGRPPGGLGGAVTIRKRNGRRWPSAYQSVEVVMDHGYTEDEAADWREAVLRMVDEISTLPIPVGAERSDADLTRKVVDDVEYAWTAQYAGPMMGAPYSVRNVLDRYRLWGIWFR